ncbi:MAG TPA: hypothetical protein VHB97_04625 [Polyangia bacterium]|jgi:hypothetical protein|nr:hypothetical protein [Polyangia bacterium]
MPGLVPYVVSFAELRAFAGSRDPNACMKIETLFKRELADEPGSDGALRRICMGEPGAGNGTPYVWALEILCAHFGQKLPNASVANADDEWLMRVVDPVFDAWRVGDFVKIKRLVYGTWPIKIPHADEPRGGAIDSADVARALDVMRTGALPKFDREIIAVIGEVRGWLEACVARNAGLVAFYY